MVRALSAMCVFVLTVGHLAGAQNAQAAQTAAQLEICCRPLHKWDGSRNWLLVALNRTIVERLHHCYVDFPAGVVVPGVNTAVRTAGIHPLERRNGNKEPILDQGTDNSDRGGACRVVKDATPEKVQRLAEEIATGACPSCGQDYHNRVLTGCFNNSNTYAYELVRGAGMTPPPMHGAPGYRRHHECGGGTSGKGPKP